MRFALAGNAAGTERSGRSDERSVFVAWEPGGWSERSSSPRRHRHSAVPLGMGRECARTREDVGHEAAGTAEDTPWWIAATGCFRHTAARDRELV